MYWCTAVAHAADGGFYFAGLTHEGPAGSTDGCLIKADSTGRQEWMREYGGEFEDAIEDMILSSDNRIIAVGYRKIGKEVYSGYNGWVLITDSMGNPIRSLHYDCGNNGGYYAICLAPDSGFMLQAGLDKNRMITKINAAGDSLWSCHYLRDPNVDIDVCQPKELDNFLGEYLDCIFQSNESCRIGWFVNENKLLWLEDWLRENGYRRGNIVYGGAGLAPDGYFWAGTVVHYPSMRY